MIFEVVAFGFRIVLEPLWEPLFAVLTTLFNMVLELLERSDPFAEAADALHG